MNCLQALNVENVRIIKLIMSCVKHFLPFQVELEPVAEMQKVPIEFGLNCQNICLN